MSVLCRCRVDGEQAVLRAAVNGVFLGCLHVVFGVQSMKNNQTLTPPKNCPRLILFAVTMNRNNSYITCFLLVGARSLIAQHT